MHSKLEEAEMIAQATAANDRMRQAILDRDANAVDQLYAPEFLLNGPGNRIQSREQTLNFLRTGRGQSLNERHIEEAYVSGDVVVLMGEETVAFRSPPDDAISNRHRRRFTNLWRKIDGQWRQFARQATNIGPAE